MYQLQARACQTKPGVDVTLAGFLANSCMPAELSGTYEGSIVHFVDPGHGEIFIDEKQRPGSRICLMHLVPLVCAGDAYRFDAQDGGDLRQRQEVADGARRRRGRACIRTGHPCVDREDEIVLVMRGAIEEGSVLRRAGESGDDPLLFAPSTTSRR